jgi:hypothetical protein
MSNMLKYGTQNNDEVAWAAETARLVRKIKQSDQARLTYEREPDVWDLEARQLELDEEDVEVLIDLLANMDQLPAAEN